MGFRQTEVSARLFVGDWAGEVSFCPCNRHIVVKYKKEEAMPTNSEGQEIEELFEKLCCQPRRFFPQLRRPLDAPSTHGVYFICKKETILHVGRTVRGKNGLYQRLKDHLQGSSSFVKRYLQGKGTILRKDVYTYQYLELGDSRKRALLEAYAIGVFCPKHIGLGE